jgi:hypothetical protein
LKNYFGEINSTCFEKSIANMIQNNHSKTKKMNLNNNPTVNQLREMIAKCDDENFHHIIWVNRNGIVNIHVLKGDDSPAIWSTANENIIQFLHESFSAGSNYVGRNASLDDWWMNKLFEVLTTNWANKTMGYVSDAT